MIAKAAALLMAAILVADGGATGPKAEIYPQDNPVVIQPEEVLEVVSEPEPMHLYGNCTITHYCGCAACCGAWGNNTASGARPTSGWTVANNVLPFGTKVEINGHVYCVEDRGDDKMNDYWFDIYCDGHQEALDRGMYSAPVYIIDD